MEYLLSLKRPTANLANHPQLFEDGVRKWHSPDSEAGMGGAASPWCLHHEAARATVHGPDCQAASILQTNVRCSQGREP